MTIMIDVTPETKRQLQTAAQQRGLNLSTYAGSLLEKVLKPGPMDLARDLPRAATPAEKAELFTKWVDSHDPTIPAVPLAALDRDSLYGEAE